MKRWISGISACILIFIFTACASRSEQPDIVATTMPVYTFTKALCDGTSLSVEQLIQENVSCLHDYTMTIKHMKMLENADLLVISGGGLEDFLSDALPNGTPLVDASAGIELEHRESAHHEHDHHHEEDPHYWLSIDSARQMATNICNGLKNAYPELSNQFEANMDKLNQTFDELNTYALEQLSQIQHRELITFHDGFSYMAESFDLTILKAIEEESGSEASARDLITICDLVTEHALPAIFIERNGSSNAAKIIHAETGVNIYSLDMAISGQDYFAAMRYNIDTLKEALE